MRAPPITRVAIACLLVAPVVATAQSLTGARQQALDRILAGVARDGPGCVAGASQDGKLLFQKAAGMASLEYQVPLTATTRFSVASISKQFTAMAVLLLARDGKLSLDDDVRTYVPELHDFGTRITIRHLLAHTHGLRDHFEILRIARGRLFENRITEADVLDILARQRELNHAPGADWLYSSTGYTLAGIIVERVSGQSLRDFTRARIFAPLGMTRTEFQDDYTMVVSDRAMSYYRGADRAWHWRLPNYDIVGPTGLVSTVADLLRWEENLAHPVVGDTTIVRLMSSTAVLSNGDSTGYGFGLFLEQYRGTPFVGHGGDDAGYHGAVGRFPRHGLAVAVLCNADGSDPGETLNQIADALLDGTLGPVATAATAATSAGASRVPPASLAGIYVDPNARPIVIGLRGDSLVYGQPESGLALVPVSDRRFRRADREVELEFRPNAEMIMTRPYFPRRVIYRRQPPSRLSASELKRYGGSYYSDELRATYVVTPRDSGLYIRTRGGALRIFRPVYGDYFEGSVDQVTFTRDRTGTVDGFLMHNIRLRNLRFRRVTDPGDASAR